MGCHGALLVCVLLSVFILLDAIASSNFTSVQGFDLRLLVTILRIELIYLSAELGERGSVLQRISGIVSFVLVVFYKVILVHGMSIHS